MGPDGFLRPVEAVGGKLQPRQASKCFQTQLELCSSQAQIGQHLQVLKSVDIRPAGNVGGEGGGCM